jgi:hypothetical protein
MSTSSIDTVKFTEACEAIANVYDALFSVGLMASQLKGDILNSSGTVKKAYLKSPGNCDTLEHLIEYELKTIGKDKCRTDKSTGIIGLLWAKRAVQFIMVYLDLLGTRGDLSSSACARQTYETVLAKYHGWFTSKTLSGLMGLAPSRDDIFLKLGLKPGPDASKAIAEMVAITSQIVSTIQGLLDKYDLDFPDKV